MLTREVQGQLTSILQQTLDHKVLARSEDVGQLRRYWLGQGVLDIGWVMKYQLDQEILAVLVVCQKLLAVSGDIGCVSGDIGWGRWACMSKDHKVQGSASWQASHSANLEPLVISQSLSPTPPKTVARDSKPIDSWQGYMGSKFSCMMQESVGTCAYVQRQR